MVPSMNNKKNIAIYIDPEAHLFLQNSAQTENMLTDHKVKFANTRGINLKRKRVRFIASEATSCVEFIAEIGMQQDKTVKQVIDQLREHVQVDQHQQGER